MKATKRLITIVAALTVTCGVTPAIAGTVQPQTQLGVAAQRQPVPADPSANVVEVPNRESCPPMDEQRLQIGKIAECEYLRRYSVSRDPNDARDKGITVIETSLEVSHTCALDILEAAQSWYMRHGDQMTSDCYGSPSREATCAKLRAMNAPMTRGIATYCDEHHPGD
jgi:hypothetical protein